MAAAAAKEETFRNYDDDQQAESYARHRPARLHTAPRCTRPLLRFHQSTGGREALLSRPSAAGPGQRNPCPRPATSHAPSGLDASPVHGAPRAGDALSPAPPVRRPKTGAPPHPCTHPRPRTSLRCAGHQPRQRGPHLPRPARRTHWFDMPRVSGARRPAGPTPRRHGRPLDPRRARRAPVHARRELLKRLVERDPAPALPPRQPALPEPVPLACRCRGPWTRRSRASTRPRSSAARLESLGSMAGGERAVSLDVGGGGDGHAQPGDALGVRRTGTGWARGEGDVVRRLRREMEEVLQGDHGVRIVMDGTLLLFKRNGAP